MACLRRPRAAVLLVLAVAAAAAVGLALRRIAYTPGADRRPDRLYDDEPTLHQDTSRRQAGSAVGREEVDAALGLILATARHDHAFAAHLRAVLSVDQGGSSDSHSDPPAVSFSGSSSSSSPASSSSTTAPSGRFTAVLQTYDRPLALLVERVAVLAACTHLASVVIIANAHPPPAGGPAAPGAPGGHGQAAAAIPPVVSKCGADGRGCWPAFPRPIAVVAEADNSMNNRFRPRPGLFAAAEAVLLLDDDLAIAASDLDTGFALWARSPHQIVSFLARAHDPAGPTYLFRVPGDAVTRAYSIGLAGCAFFHRDYLDQYWAPAQAPARALVDRMHNCDDLVLNCLVANATGLPPLVVPATVVAYEPVSATGELVRGMSQGRNWRAERNACLVHLQALYGGVLPLRWNTMASINSGGRRDIDLLPHNAVWIDTVAERGYLPAHGHGVGTPSVAAASVCLGRAVRFDAAVAERGMRLIPRRPRRFALNPAEPWTVEVWAAPEGGRTATLAVVVLSGPTGAAALAPIVLGFKEHAGYLAFGTGPHDVLRDAVLLPPDRFVHLAAVYTGRAYRLYVNGRLAAASNTAAQPASSKPVGPKPASSTTTSSSSYEITVAANPTDRPGAAFHGRVQELRLWQRVRSGRELRRAMVLGYASPGGDGPDDGPLYDPAHRRLPPAGLLAHVPTLHDTLGHFDAVAVDPVTLADGMCLAPSATLLRPHAPAPPVPAVAVVITTYRGRPQNLHRILRHLAAHAPFITEVVVWRNSAEAPGAAPDDTTEVRRRAEDVETSDGGDRGGGDDDGPEDSSDAALVRDSAGRTEDSSDAALVRTFGGWPEDSSDAPLLGASKGRTVDGSPRPSSVFDLFESVQVIHAPENLFTEGRYRGCAAAHAPVCYVLDDDFVPTGVHGLLASYLRAPRLLHVVTDTHTALLNHHWTYIHEAASAAPTKPLRTLHAGFAWLGAGAMLARATAERFLRQMDDAGLDADARAHADLYMAVWMNRLPVVTTVVLNTTGLEQGSAHSCATCTHARARNVHHLQQAVRLLQQRLLRDGEGDDDTAPSERIGSDGALTLEPGCHFLDAHVDEACARAVYRSQCISDRCTLITNVQTWPCVVNPSFDLDADLVAQTSRDNLTVPYDDALHFVHAVDGDPATAWRPARDLRPGDYVGLDLLRPTVLVGVRVQCEPGGGGRLPPAVAWEVTVDGVHWDGLRSDSSDDGDDDDDDDAGAVHAASATYDAATGTTLLGFKPARVLGVRFVLTQPWRGRLRVFEVSPLFWSPPPVAALTPPAPSRHPLVRVAYVVDDVLDPATASAETRALVDEAVVLAAAADTVADVTVLVPGRRGRPAPDALEQLVPGAAPSANAPNGPNRPRLVVVPPSNVSYTVAPADSVQLRIALDLLDWFRATPSVADVVIFAVYQSPMLHVLRAHALGTLAPSTVFAARAWRRTATDDLALHSRFASGPHDLLHIFLEETALALADSAAPVPMAGAALGAHVRAYIATAAAVGAVVVRSVQIIAVATPSTADADWRVLLDAASRLPADVLARISLLGTASPPPALKLPSPPPVAPVDARTWRDVLVYAAEAPGVRVLWILDRSTTASYWEAAAVAAGVSVVDRGNGTISAALEILSALASAVPSASPAAPAAAAAHLPLLRRSLRHAAIGIDVVRDTVLELHATRDSLVPRPLARRQAASLGTLGMPANLPSVTVCVPVYGRTDYLDATLASLRASSYPPERLHVVLADDGSAADADVRYLDALRTRVASFAGTWTVLRLPHRSAPAARNAAIAHATTGKYVLMFDSDDLLRPDALVRAVSAAERAHADVVVGWVQTFRERETEAAGTGAGTLQQRGHVWAAAGVDAALGMFGNAFGGGSALFLRSTLERVGGYRVAAPGTAHLDYELLSRIVVGGGRLVLLPEVLYDYRSGARGSIFASSSSTHANQRFSLGAYQLAYPHLAGVFEVAFAATFQPPLVAAAGGLGRGTMTAAVTAAAGTVLPAVLADVDVWLYINLAHRVDRLAHVLEQLRAVGVPPERSIRIGAVRHRWPAVGCAQSHLAALDRATEVVGGGSRGRWVAILEDDFVWAQDTPATAVAAALTNRPEFDVLLGAPNVRTLKLDPTDTAGGNGLTVRVLKAQSALLYIVRTGYLPTLRANVAESAARLAEAAAAWEATPVGQRNDTRFDRTYALDQYWKRLMPKATWITAFPALGRHWTSFSDIEGRVYGETSG